MLRDHLGETNARPAKFEVTSSSSFSLRRSLNPIRSTLYKNHSGKPLPKGGGTDQTAEPMTPIDFYSLTRRGGSPAGGPVALLPAWDSLVGSKRLR